MRQSGRRDRQRRVDCGRQVVLQWGLHKLGLRRCGHPEMPAHAVPVNGHEALARACMKHAAFAQVLACALAFATPTLAEGPLSVGTYYVRTPGDIVVTGKVHPLVPPPGADLTHFYPEKATQAQVEGSALLRCKGGSEREVTDCAVVAEKPAGYDFGSTALRLASLVDLSARGHGEDVVFVPFTFKLDEPAMRPVARLVVRPHWSTSPTAVVMTQTFRAFAPKLKGRAWAVIECDVGLDGHMDSCGTLVAEPSDVGVADAAAVLAAKFVMRKTDQDHKPVAGARVLMIMG